MQSSRDFGFERKGFPQGACASEEAACALQRPGLPGGPEPELWPRHWELVCFLRAMVPAAPPPASRQPRNSFVHWGSELLTLKGHGS